MSSPTASLLAMPMGMRYPSPNPYPHCLVRVWITCLHVGMSRITVDIVCQLYSLLQAALSPSLPLLPFSSRCVPFPPPMRQRRRPGNTVGWAPAWSMAPRRPVIVSWLLPVIRHATSERSSAAGHLDLVAATATRAFASCPRCCDYRQHCPPVHRHRLTPPALGRRGQWSPPCARRPLAPKACHHTTIVAPLFVTPRVSAGRAPSAKVWYPCPYSRRLASVPLQPPLASADVGRLVAPCLRHSCPAE